MSALFPCPLICPTPCAAVLAGGWETLLVGAAPPCCRAGEVPFAAKEEAGDALAAFAEEIGREEGREEEDEEEEAGGAAAPGFAAEAVVVEPPRREEKAEAKEKVPGRDESIREQ